MSLKWYVVHAYSGYEDRVMDSLKERAERYDMEDQFGEILVGVSVDKQQRTIAPASKVPGQ